MGARPSSFRKQGGGFLNGVDGVLNAIFWTDESPTGEPFKPGKVKGRDGKLKERFHSLFGRISVRVDGADEDVQTSLFAGSADDFKIAEDGSEIWDADYETPEAAEEAEAAEPGSTRQIGSNTSFGKFVTSAVEGGFPESELNETRLEFSGMLGYRYRFVQRKDEEGTKRAGKRLASNGKEYDRTELVIEECYGKAEGSEPPAKAAAPAKAAPAKAAPTKGNGKANGHADAVEFNIDHASTAVLRDILASEKNNTTTKQKLGLRVLNKLTKGHPYFEQRDDIRKYLFNDKVLGNIEGVSYDKASGEISLDA